MQYRCSDFCSTHLVSKAPNAEYPSPFHIINTNPYISTRFQLPVDGADGVPQRALERSDFDTRPVDPGAFPDRGFHHVLRIRDNDFMLETGFILAQCISLNHRDVFAHGRTVSVEEREGDLRRLDDEHIFIPAADRVSKVARYLGLAARVFAHVKHAPRIPFFNSLNNSVTLVDELHGIGIQNGVGHAGRYALKARVVGSRVKGVPRRQSRGREHERTADPMQATTPHLEDSAPGHIGCAGQRRFVGRGRSPPQRKVTVRQDCLLAAG